MEVIIILKPSIFHSICTSCMLNFIGVNMRALENKEYSLNLWDRLIVFIYSKYRAEYIYFVRRDPIAVDFLT